jgi:hypothetical protein
VRRFIAALPSAASKSATVPGSGTAAPAEAAGDALAAAPAKSENAFAPTVTMRLEPRVTGPLPRFRLLLPTKVKSPFQSCGLLAESVIAAPLVLSIEPPEIDSGPDPSAAALFTASSPALSCVPPL